MNRKLLEKLEQGDVVRYHEKDTIYPTYLIVQKSENGLISGEMAGPFGVNAISIDKILEAEDVSIAKWKKI